MGETGSFGDGFACRGHHADSLVSACSTRRTIQVHTGRQAEATFSVAGPAPCGAGSPSIEVTSNSHARSCQSFFARIDARRHRSRFAGDVAAGFVVTPPFTSLHLIVEPVDMRLGIEGLSACPASPPKPRWPMAASRESSPTGNSKPPTKAPRICFTLRIDIYRRRCGCWWIGWWKQLMRFELHIVAVAT